MHHNNAPFNTTNHSFFNVNIFAVFLLQNLIISKHNWSKFWMKSPTPPPLPSNLPPLPDTPKICSYSDNLSHLQSTHLVLPQDPPDDDYFPSPIPSSRSSSPSLSTSELLKIIKSSQVDLKRSLGMIESISERTNQVARLCQALKSPKKSSLKTATPTLDNDEEVMDYEEGDVVDEINKSFTRSSANELPSTTASQATMQILLIEIRTLIREFQENRRHQTSQPAPIPTTASFPSNDVHKTGAAIAEAPSSAPLAHTGGDHHDLLKIDAPVAPTSPTPFSTPAPSFPDSPVLSPYSPPPFSPASSPKSPPLTVAPLEASLPNTSEFNEPLRPPVAPLNRPPYDPNKYLPEIVRESVESTKLTLNDLVPHFAKKRREAKLNRLKKLPHKGDDRPIKQPSFPQREATIMAKTYSPVKTLSPRCNFKERALNSKMPCLRGSEAKRKAAVSPPFVYDRPSARAAHVHPTKAEVRVQYR